MGVDVASFGDYTAAENNEPDTYAVTVNDPISKVPQCRVTLRIRED